MSGLENEVRNVDQLIQRLDQIYCGPISVEFDGVQVSVDHLLFAAYIGLKFRCKTCALSDRSFFSLSLVQRNILELVEKIIVSALQTISLVLGL
jgi:hypothetical protein